MVWNVSYTVANSFRRLCSQFEGINGEISLDKLNYRDQQQLLSIVGKYTLKHLQQEMACLSKLWCTFRFAASLHFSHYSFVLGVTLYVLRMKTLILDQQQLQILSAEVGALRQHCQLQISLVLHTVATISLLSCPTVNCHVNTLLSSTDALQSCYLIL